MSKRFTDTDKFKKHFVRSLEPAYKLFWFYILDDCNHAGIWEVDFQIASIYCGTKIDPAPAKEKFKDKYIEISNGTKWFIPDFILFQYGELNAENRAHNSVILLLSKYKLLGPSKGLIRSLQGRKDKDKDMDKDKDKDKEKEKNGISFEKFWDLYAKKEDRKKCEKKWEILPDKTKHKILETLPAYIQEHHETKFRKNPYSYLNGECWNDEVKTNPFENLIAKYEKEDAAN